MTIDNVAAAPQIQFISTSYELGQQTMFNGAVGHVTSGPEKFNPEFGTKAVFEVWNGGDSGPLLLRDNVELQAIRDLFNYADNPKKVTDIFEMGETIARFPIAEFAIGLWALRQHKDNTNADRLGKEFCKVMSGLKGIKYHTPLAVWTPKGASDYKKIAKLKTELNICLKNLKVDLYRSTMKNFVVPAVIANVERLLGDELTDESKKQVEAADGLMTTAAYQAVENLLRGYQEEPVKLTARVNQIKLALTTSELTRSIESESTATPATNPPQTPKPGPEKIAPPEKRAQTEPMPDTLPVGDQAQSKATSSGGSRTSTRASIQWMSCLRNICNSNVRLEES